MSNVRQRVDTRRDLVLAIAALVEDRYVSPNVAKRVASDIRGNLDAGVYAGLEPVELAERLTHELRTSSGDLHLRVRHTVEPHQPDAAGAIVREQNDRAEHCLRMGYGIASTQILPSCVAVMDLRELVEPELSRPAYEAALASVAEASALVFDLRQCVGGDPKTVALVCSHLVDGRAPLSSISPRSEPEEAFWADPAPYPRRFGGEKPVFFVTATFTFSGAEMLAYDLQALKRAVVVGAVTGGGANPCAFHWPSPHFSVLMPEARAVNPITGTNWEGRGVIPDVSCQESDALRRAIELAEAHANVA
jgi:hypothetical protein